MAVIPAVIPYGSGAEMPHLIKDLIKSMDDSPSALTGRSMPGMIDAWKSLQKNKFNSFHGTDNNYGAAKNIFHKRNFFHKLAKVSVLSSMLVKEKHCLRDSPNGRQDSNNFNAELTRSLKICTEERPGKDNNAVTKRAPCNGSKKVKYTPCLINLRVLAGISPRSKGSEIRGIRC